MPNPDLQLRDDRVSAGGPEPVAARGRGSESRPAPGAASWARLVPAGVLLYAAIDTALLFLRPKFSLLHNAESDYGSSGSWAWLMDLNFVLRCLLSLAAVRALALAAPADARPGRLRLGLGLLATWAITSGLLAFFPDDPVGTPTHGSGRVHLALALIAFLAVLVGAIAVSRALATDRRWKSLATPLMAFSWGALIPVLLLGHAHFRRTSLGGLYEKLFLGVELIWLVLVTAPIALELRSPGSAEPAPVSRAG